MDNEQPALPDIGGEPSEPGTPAIPVKPASPTPKAGDENGLPQYFSSIDFKTNIDPPRIDFTRAKGSPASPPEIRSFRLQIEDVVRVINVVFQNDKQRRDGFLSSVHVAASSGLIGSDYSLAVGGDNLEEVRKDIADAYPLVRAPIWVSNMIFLIGMLAICAIAAAAHRYFGGTWYPMADTPGSTMLTSLALAFFLIPMGVSVGLFAEFLFRANDDIPFEQLKAINPGRWKPVQRAFNTVVVAWIFAGLLAVGAFQVGAANVLLNDFVDKKPFLSGIIGFLTGFAFPYVRDLVQQIRPVRRDGTS